MKTLPPPGAISSSIVVFSGVSGVRVPPPRAALGDRSVFVHRPALAGLLWRAEGRRHGLPLPDLRPPSAHHASAVSAGPGERSPHPAAPAGKRPRLPGLEGVQHAALKAFPEQPE